jgi:hypothetical protein
MILGKEIKISQNLKLKKSTGDFYRNCIVLQEMYSFNRKLLDEEKWSLKRECKYLKSLTKIDYK